MRPADKRPDDIQQLRTDLDARFRAPLMSFFARRLHKRVDAEDLTQETLLRVVDASGADNIQDAPAFVFRVAINLLHDHHRKALRTGSPLFVPIEDALAAELDGQLQEDFSPERVLIGRDTLAAALDTLNELGGLTRDIFILFRVERMKQKDIAALYSIGQSTVEKHVMKAVAYLAARHGSR